MPIHSRYLFSAAMDVDPSHERLFNEVYDREHVPSLLTVPGVVAVSRYELQPLTMSIGGQLKTIVIEHAPKYGALYEIESQIGRASGRDIERISDDMRQRKNAE